MVVLGFHNNTSVLAIAFLHRILGNTQTNVPVSANMFFTHGRCAITFAVCRRALDWYNQYELPKVTRLRSQAVT